MYPPIIIVPAAAVCWSVANHFVGPRRVRDATWRVADWIADRIGACQKPIIASDIACELRWIERMQLRPWVACFETACAFSVWLAFHGQKSTVRMGKRVEQNRLLMHAWVESSGESFFYDARFEPVFEEGAPYCPSGR